MIFLVLISSIIDKFIRGCVELGAAHHFREAGIGLLAFFVLLCLLIVVLPLFTLCYKEKKCCSCSIMFFLLQLMVAALYYFGDNIDYFASMHNVVLNCDKDCQQKLVIVKQVCVGTTTLFIFTMPYLSHDPRKNKRTKHFVLSIINMLIKVDMIYSLVTTNLVDPYGGCSFVKVLSFSFYCIAILIGWVGIVKQSIKETSSINKDQAASVCNILSMWIGVIFLLVSLPMYILADNQQPLQCQLLNSTNFDPFRNLTTIDIHSISGTYFILKLAFTCITALCVLLVFVLVK